MKTLWLGILIGGMAFTSRAAEQTLHLDLGSGTSIDLLLVHAGEFTQGSPADQPGRGSDETQRQVRLTHDFYISRTAVTRGQWERFIAETHYRTEAEDGKSGGYGWDGNALTQRKDFTWRNPGFSQDATHPVCLVTFSDAQAFCKWLEKKAKRKTLLPTEAQWEYACRAGTTTPWFSGSDPIGWHKGNSGNTTHPADSSSRNTWGLVIGGNVSEWCLDWYGLYDMDHSTDPRQDNPNLSDKPRRVVRGGSWNRDAKNTRSAARYRVDPRSRNADIGFRIVCETSVIAPIVEAPLDAPPVKPPVREEPAPPPPPAAPGNSQFHSTAGSLPGSSIVMQQSDHMIPGWLCFLIPVGFIIAIIRLAIRGRATSSDGGIEAIADTVRRHAGNSLLSSAQRGVPPPLNLHPGVRMVDNGFWINSDWAVGTPIHLSYLVNGVMEQQTLVYQPGNQGQFIFTGVRPDNVNVSTTGNFPPPLSSPPPLFDQRDDDQFSQSYRPSFRPSAY
ncbi:MAG: formylglycine-generating enzyme family protein [Luteolibacter sp.]